MQTICEASKWLTESMSCAGVFSDKHINKNNSDQGSEHKNNRSWAISVVLGLEGKAASKGGQVQAASLKQRLLLKKKKLK